MFRKFPEDIQEILESVKNVREVNLGGNREEVIHVQMRPSRLTTLGISSTQVRDVIQDHNIDRSWDLVRDDAIGAQVRFFSRFRALSDLENLPVSRLADNRVVRLEEVADVYRGLEREEGDGHRSGAAYLAQAVEPAATEGKRAKVLVDRVQQRLGASRAVRGARE